MRSTLFHDPNAERDLTPAEQRAELEVARAIVREVIVLTGLRVAAAEGIEVTMSCRLTTTVGKAVCLDAQGKRIRYLRIPGRRPERMNDAAPWPNPRGEIRLSASALWIRDTPQGRRNTVIHELAHILAESKQPGTPSHGPVWKAVMRSLGAAPTRCHKVKPVRKGNRRSVPAPVLARRRAVGHGFQVGDVVVFGRKRGEKTRARVEKVNRKSLTVVTLEERGRGRGKDAGRTWRVPPSLCVLEDEQPREHRYPSLRFATLP